MAVGDGFIIVIFRNWMGCLRTIRQLEASVPGLAVEWCAPRLSLANLSFPAGKVLNVGDYKIVGFHSLVLMSLCFSGSEGWFQCVFSPFVVYFSRDPSKAQLHSFADKLEYVKQLRVLLASKDFQERLKGIDQLVVDCEENPSMVICNMVPVIYQASL